MRSEPIDELLLVRYLLGTLTEEEQIRVEDRAFAEPDYMETLEAAEADLIDAYVRSELPQADREAFERRFLMSPQRRSKVEFARALARVTAQIPPFAFPASERLSIWQVLSRPSSSALRFAPALAAVFCVAGISWVASDNASMRSRLSALEAQRRDLQVRGKGLEQELSKQQSRAESLAAQMQSRPSPERQHSPVIASLVLMAGPTRSEARIEQLVLGPETQVAHIEIQLEPMDNYPRFRAVLSTRSGKEIMVLSDITARRTGAGNTVAVDFPASALATEGYELALKGLSGGQAAQDIGYYYFAVRKR